MVNGVRKKVVNSPSCSKVSAHRARIIPNEPKRMHAATRFPKSKKMFEKETGRKNIAAARIITAVSSVLARPLNKYAATKCHGLRGMMNNDSACFVHRVMKSEKDAFA